MQDAGGLLPALLARLAGDAVFQFDQEIGGVDAGRAAAQDFIHRGLEFLVVRSVGGSCAFTRSGG
jgi:hypothetical protein